MIYVHIPFCRSFCTYCDFYSELVGNGTEGDEEISLYIDSLCSEISRRRAEISAASSPNTLYIGGGTPSLLPLKAFGHILDSLHPAGHFQEFTVEVNPDDLTSKGGDYAAGLKSLGVNRISMGVQSLDDGILKWMNRRHDARDAHRAFEILRAAGFKNISVDVIFGISQLSDEVLGHTLDCIIGWLPEHISAYQLSIEDGSALCRMVREGRYKEASEAQCSRQYSLICRRLCEAGYGHYEISNWALPGFEALHNSAYWTRRPYVGLGPGAHSFDGVTRSFNSDSPASWSSSFETLSFAEVREEQIMLGLRTAGGIPADLCDAATVDRLLGEGALERDASRIRIPESRFFVSDEIIEELV